MAAKKLGLKEVPILLVEHLKEEQKRAYIIDDKRLALDAGWDEEMLRVEIAELEDLGFDLQLTGFEPVDGGDVLLVNSGLIPLEMAGADVPTMPIL